MKKRILYLLLAFVLCLSFVACGTEPETPAAPEDDGQTVPTTAYQTELALPTEQTEPTEQASHVYDNDCDEDCNECGETRIVSDHTYSSACDGECDSCGEQREVSDHEYDNDCDAKCNVCREERATNHGKNADQVGHCADCGEYAGMICDVNYPVTAEFGQKDTLYFRFAAGQNMKHSIRFEGADAVDYQAYIFAGDAYQPIELTDTPQSFVSLADIFLVITQKDGAAGVTFQIEEVQ